MKIFKNHNLGIGDRVIRVLVGILILVAGLYNNTLWGLLGLVPMVTAAVGWCPAYAAAGVSSKPSPRDSDPRLFL